MMSPVAAAKPQASALPFPVPFWTTTRMSGRIIRATAIVSSVERPSTSTTSSTQSGIRVSTCGRFAASLSVGTTTLISALSDRRRAARPPVRGASAVTSLLFICCPFVLGVQIVHRSPTCGSSRPPLPRFLRRRCCCPLDIPRDTHGHGNSPQVQLSIGHPSRYAPSRYSSRPASPLYRSSEIGPRRSDRLSSRRRSRAIGDGARARRRRGDRRQISADHWVGRLARTARATGWGRALAPRDGPIPIAGRVGGRGRRLGGDEVTHDRRQFAIGRGPPCEQEVA